MFANRSLLFISFICCMICACGGSSSKKETSNVSNVVSPIEGPLELPVVVKNTLNDEVTPQIAIQQMGIGINLGNTLDAPLEGDWALSAEEYYLQAFKDAGFKHVRIPITWDKRTSVSAPYSIDESFLDRVDQIVTWALDRDFYVIINVHHDDWVKQKFVEQSTQNRFYAIWMQITERFKSHSAKLIFEILNEPQQLSVENTDTLNQQVLNIIRNQTTNRLVVFAGNEWSNIDRLHTAKIPGSTDQFLIGNFHSYDPWAFAGECKTSWGTPEDIDELRAIYQKAFDWSQTHQIPLMVNEFGSAKYDFTQPENQCVQSEREHYLMTHVALANEFNIAATFWDDGGSFSTYDRAENAWGPEKDILVVNNQ